MCLNIRSTEIFSCGNHIIQTHRDKLMSVVVVVKRLQLCITCILMVFSEKILNFLSFETFTLPTGLLV